MRESIIKILNDCNLTEKVLPIWSSNGIGIDPNANSIHKFNILQKYRQTHRFGNLRYNDIPAYMPSPIGFWDMNLLIESVQKQEQFLIILLIFIIIT